MIAKDIRTLLEKLSELCTKSLEASVGYCVRRTHYELMWEHILLQFIENTNSDVVPILRHYSINFSRLHKALVKDLEQLPTGNTSKPMFSPSLINTIEQAWILASLVYEKDEVSSGILFVGAQDSMQRSVTASAAELRTIDPQQLKNDLMSIIADSPEQTVSLSGAAERPAGSKEALEKYCKNFTQEAKDGKIDIILGRDDEIRQVVDILCRRRKNNPIVVGEAGVGKTAIIEGLALRIVKGDVPDTLKEVELWELDLGLLQAGASVKGEFEKRLKAVIDIAKGSSENIILFIDEAHTLIGAGGSAGSSDAANLLKPALARGELRTCAATTFLEYRKYFEKDPALTRRFQMIKIEEPDEEKAFAMLRGIAESYEKHHHVHITDDGIRAAVSYSNRYISGRQLPDKAIDVLDTACTRVKMSRTTTPAILDNAQRDFNNANKALQTLLKDDSTGIPVPKYDIDTYKLLLESSHNRIDELTGQWENEKERVNEILNIQKCLLETPESEEETHAELKNRIEQKVRELASVQGENPMVFPFVSSELCADVIAGWTGIPVGSMVRDEAKKLLELEVDIQKRVVGQEMAIGNVAEVIRAAKTGMTNPDAPMGVFLFTGPSGTGKTECALALADVLFGGEKFSTVINMSEYQEKHTSSQLKGSPPGYVGYGEGGVLTEAVRQKPYSIVILDETEKAHKDVLNLFYQVFDKGFMRDGEGRDINFRNTVIIMTSNLGSETIFELCNKEGEESPGKEEIIDAIRPELTSHFQASLLARCRIIPFRPLDNEAMKSIVILKLEKIVRRLKSVHNIDFEYSPELVETIARKCSNIESGARNIDVIIDQTLLPTISSTLLSQLCNEEEPYTKVIVSYSEEESFSIGFE